jgi:hypothetical protein
MTFLSGGCLPYWECSPGYPDLGCRHDILWFDPRREHSSAPISTYALPSRESGLIEVSPQSIVIRDIQRMRDFGC